MIRADDLLPQDISLWLAGESAGGAADRAVAALENDIAVRRSTGAAIAVEDLVRDWYGGIPLPPPEPMALERRRRTSLVSASLVAVAAGLATAILLHGDGRPLERAVTSALTASDPWPPLASSSVWRLRRQDIGQ